MQLMGLEPTPGNPDMNLNHARMPIPPQLQNPIFQRLIGLNHIYFYHIPMEISSIFSEQPKLILLFMF
jgi:hypothetical protein